MVARPLALLLAFAARLVLAQAETVFCQADYSPVCGTDGETYPNECALNEKARTSDSDLTVAYEGECCGDSVCGTDGITYRTKCKLKSVNQVLGLHVMIDYDGACCADRACDLQLLDADAVDAPVCASNGELYSTACAFLAAQCEARQKLWPVPGVCCEPGSRASGHLCHAPPPHS